MDDAPPSLRTMASDWEVLILLPTMLDSAANTSSAKWDPHLRKLTEPAISATSRAASKGGQGVYETPFILRLLLYYF